MPLRRARLRNYKDSQENDSRAELGTLLNSILSRSGEEDFLIEVEIGFGDSLYIVLAANFPPGIFGNPAAQPGVVDEDFERSRKRLRIVTIHNKTKLTVF